MEEAAVVLKRLQVSLSSCSLFFAGKVQTSDKKSVVSWSPALSSSFEWFIFDTDTVARWAAAFPKNKNTKKHPKLNKTINYIAWCLLQCIIISYIFETSGWPQLKHIRGHNDKQ